ncbi:hypothetical protein NDU88_004359 [Pleurodeles waltl]|uniref:Uncharacterized protein n=1 Tax=Pleurodeles waltl TaxID=8319 RepID=A0AAV7NMG1_PLEWA|nr:hypothetical protein NDU88_004359 [Pleurodeles waltl]
MTTMIVVTIAFTRLSSAGTTTMKAIDEDFTTVDATIDNSSVNCSIVNGTTVDDIAKEGIVNSKTNNVYYDDQAA